MEGKTGVRSKAGPEPQRVKIDGDWEEAVGKALKKKPPKKAKPKKGKGA